jgi:hypothetical protein
MSSYFKNDIIGKLDDADREQLEQSIQGWLGF